ncbi:MAG TPA: BA14K family protein [Xanthobacteraceae bacterium]|nr:BA14K family protein [Xanthobacteraceae bacterium]
MRLTKWLAPVALAAATTMALSAPGVAAPMFTGPALSQSAPSSFTEVQYRRHHHHHRGHYYRGGGGNNAGAIIGGLAAGAIIGGAIAASQAQAAQQAQANHAYCAQRFRSYDPRSGTYLGHDGYRHACP